MDAAIEAGADDVSSDEEGHTILCAFENLNEVSKALEASLGEAESAKIIWKPQNNIPVDEDRAQSLMKLVGNLEDDDDVQNVYANFEVDEATLAKLFPNPTLAATTQRLFTRAWTQIVTGQ